MLLMRIYTKFGDKGKTSLVGKVTDKDDPRVAAYGEIDELNAAIGTVIAFCKYNDIKEILTPIQKDLFTIGADLANPLGEKLNRISPIRVSELEKTIDEIWAELPALIHFIMPSGTQTAALLHLARTVCRRAERSIVALSKKEKVNTDILVYINRLGDLLFTLARFANRKERIEEVIWKGKK